RAARRAGAGGEVGAVAEHDAGAVHDPRPADHLHPGLAARVDRDHRDLHADLHPALAALRHRPAVLWAARGAESANGLPVPAGGDGGVLPERRLAAARHAQPDIRGHDAVHGYPGDCRGVAVPVPGDRPVAAPGVVRSLRSSLDGKGNLKPKILVTRATFEDVIAELRERFEVEDNQKDATPLFS